MPSTLSSFPFIANGSEATPELWNRIFSALSSNIATLDSSATVSLPSGNTLSVFSSVDASQHVHAGEAMGIGPTPSAVTTGAMTIAVRSDTSDYIHFEDTSGLRSDYLIGSRVGGTADGLNIYDLSGQTMIASFSKQSIRFFQNVVGPVFDVGGALANTLNAATFGTGADSDESRIQAAMDQAAISSISRVYLPANMYPYSASSMSFYDQVQLVREGGDWSVYDAWAYGATPSLSLVRSNTSAIQAALDATANTGKVVYVPSGAYGVTGLSFYSSNVLRGAGSGGQGAAQLYQPSANTTILRPKVPGATTKFFSVEDLILSSFGNIANMGLLDCVDTFQFAVRRVQFSGASRFAFRVTGGATAGDAGFGSIQDCRFGTTQPGGTDVLLQSTANDQPDGMTILNCNFSVSSHISVIGSVSTLGGHGAGSIIVIGCRVESSGTDTSIFTGPTGNSIFVGNRFETTTSGATLRVTLYPDAPGTTTPCGAFVANAYAAPGGIVFIDKGFDKTIRWGEAETGPIIRNEVHDGLAISPAMSFRSENSLGWYRSGNSAMGISYGQIHGVSGTALQPGFGFSSESSLGFFRSGTSSMALSYGSLRLPVGGELLLTASGTNPSYRFFTQAGIGYLTINRSQAFAQDNSGQASWTLEFNPTAGVNDKLNIAHNNPGGGGVTIASLNSIGGWLGASGAAISPWVAFTSEASLGLFRSGVSRLGMTYGQFTIQDGSNTTPSIGLSSATSIGFYSSGVQTIAQSLGTFNLATNAVRLSMRTLAASAVTASAAKTNVATNEVVFTVGGASGVSLCISSGGTLYFFNSDGSAILA